MFHFCTVHDKIYLYFICLTHFMQRKESSYITLEKYAYTVLIRASLHQFHTDQRCSPPFCCLPRKVTSIITLSRLNRKHLPIQHHNFLKTKQNEIHRSRKVGGGGGFQNCPCSCTSIVSLVELQSKNIYIRLYAIAFHSYMSRSDYTQQG